MKAVEYGVRNAMKDSCEECGKEVIYEKDDDSGLATVEVEPGNWQQLCDKCAEPYEERERRYHEEEQENAPDAAFILIDRHDGEYEEGHHGFGDLGQTLAEAWHVIHSGRTFLRILAGDRVLYDNDSIQPVIQRIAVIHRQGAGESVEEAARLVAAEEQRR